MEATEAITALEDGIFAPADLLCLAKVLGEEATTCQSLLRDELEKRKRYKVSIQYVISYLFGKSLEKIYTKSVSFI